MKDARLPVLLVFALLLTGTPAHAYIDPNIGGQIYQAIYPVLAVLLGLLAFARQWLVALWHRFTALLRSLFSRA